MALKEAPDNELPVKKLRKKVKLFVDNYTQTLFFCSRGDKVNHKLIVEV